MGIEAEVVEHFIRIFGNQKEDFVEESYFFLKKGQKYIFRFSLDDRPKIVQHVCEVSRDINRVKEHYFYEHMFNIMTQFVDLTKLVDES